MDESEQALRTAAQKNSGTDARIAKQILNDAKVHGLWEVRHAELVRPVAEHNSRVPQCLEKVRRCRKIARAPMNHQDGS
jgi:hypothetical protein